ncbi:MAG: VPLPA-CTERM sorting domain-containing protein [Paracoccaceae bacterium]
MRRILLAAAAALWAGQAEAATGYFSFEYSADVGGRYPEFKPMSAINFGIQLYEPFFEQFDIGIVRSIEYYQVGTATLTIVGSKGSYTESVSTPTYPEGVTYEWAFSYDHLDTTYALSWEGYADPNDSNNTYSNVLIRFDENGDLTSWQHRMNYGWGGGAVGRTVDGGVAKGTLYNYGEDMDWPVLGTYSYTNRYEPDAAPVPLPATAALLPLGIGALAIMRRRRPA